MKMRAKRNLVILMFCLVKYVPTLLAIDNAHFFKSAHFHGIQSRDTSDWRTKVDVDYAYGAARTGYNSHGLKTSVFNIYENSNILYLGTGVPKLAAVTDWFNTLELLVNQSETNSNFGKLAFEGKFMLNEANLDLRQNIASGFFLEGHLPIRSVKTEGIKFVDQSPTSGPFTKDTAEWVQVKNNLNTIINAYGIYNYNTPYDRTDVGDLSIMLGWQTTEDKDPEFLDYYSLAFRAGVLLPTGSRDHTGYAFSLPTGHNEHWGIPARFDFMIGALDWLEVGVHGGALFFFDKTYNRRMRTNANQTGFIKLGEGLAKVERGTLWDIGGYAKIERFFKGLSGYVGYSFNNKERDDLSPQNTTIFSNSVVNDDKQYRDWHMHTMHLMLEYDFAFHITKRTLAPTVDVHYDFPIGGKRVFSTNMYGGGLGANFRWKI